MKLSAYDVKRSQAFLQLICKHLIDTRWNKSEVQRPPVSVLCTCHPERDRATLVYVATTKGSLTRSLDLPKAFDSSLSSRTTVRLRNFSISYQITLSRCFIPISKLCGLGEVIREQNSIVLEKLF